LLYKSKKKTLNDVSFLDYIRACWLNNFISHLFRFPLKKESESIISSM